MKIQSIISILVLFIFSLNTQAQQSVNTSESDTTKQEEQVFIVVEEMPLFPGGEAAMAKFIQENIVYPHEEQKAGIQGKVFVTFVVEKDGSISSAKIIRGVNGGPGLVKEALRVISSMPAWIPGKQNGNLVRVQFNLPINFTLKEEIKNESNK